jgi:hypothetical protein
LIQKEAQVEPKPVKKFTSIPQFYFPSTGAKLSKEELKRDLV